MMMMTRRRRRRSLGVGHQRSEDNDKAAGLVDFTDVHFLMPRISHGFSMLPWGAKGTLWGAFAQSKPSSFRTGRSPCNGQVTINTGRETSGIEPDSRRQLIIFDGHFGNDPSGSFHTAVTLPSFFIHLSLSLSLSEVYPNEQQYGFAHVCQHYMYVYRQCVRFLPQLRKGRSIDECEQRNTEVAIFLSA